MEKVASFLSHVRCVGRIQLREELCENEEWHRLVSLVLNTATVICMWFKLFIT